MRSKMYLAAFVAAILFISLPCVVQAQEQGLGAQVPVEVKDFGLDGKTGNFSGQLSGVVVQKLNEHSKQIRSINNQLDQLQARVARGDVRATKEFRRLKSRRKAMAQRFPSLRRIKELTARVRKLETTVSSHGERLKTVEEDQAALTDSVGTLASRLKKMEDANKPASPEKTPATSGTGGGVVIAIIGILLVLAILFFVMKKSRRGKGPGTDEKEVVDTGEEQPPPSPSPLLAQ